MGYLTCGSLNAIVCRISKMGLMKFIVNLRRAAAALPSAGYFEVFSSTGHHERD
jgi:hypothetical protein